MLTVFVNPERCIGCLQCEFACAVEHSATRAPALAVAERPVPRKRIHVHAGERANTSFPTKCRHCDPAPCIQVCPTSAIFRDREHDAVLIDVSKCIGCAMCAMVCPFDVLTFHALADGPAAVAVKCDGCIERLRAGRVPACAEACKAGALEFGELNQLVVDHRRRDTAAILAATTTGDATPATPASIAAWRSLGAVPGQPGGVR